MCFAIVTTVPLLKDLSELVTPKYAIHWKLIGTQLKLPSYTLDIIEYDNVYKAIPCCNDMFSQWLKLDTSASWKTLFSVIESEAMYTARALNKGEQFVHQ